MLRALQSVVAHDRLDAEFESEQDQVAAADELLTPISCSAGRGRNLRHCRAPSPARGRAPRR